MFNVTVTFSEAGCELTGVLSLVIAWGTTDFQSVDEGRHRRTGSPSYKGRTQPCFKGVTESLAKQSQSPGVGRVLTKCSLLGRR
jgi:hypothetical protein